MELKFDSKFLIENGINPNQMLILTSVKEGKRKELAKIAKGLGEDPFIFDYNRLVDRGIVTGDLYIDSELTQVGEDLITGKDQFSELLENFPVSVIRKDGTKDYLRTDKKKAERLYKRITRGRRDIHEHIINCLKYEIEQRVIGNSMMWFKKLPNWLSSNEWENWNERMKEDEIEKIFGAEVEEYGTSIE